MQKLLFIPFFTLSFFSFFSCSTLVGTVDPVDGKSAKYNVFDLAKEKSHSWKKLTEEKSNQETSEMSDVAFQSLDESSIISLNSACRGKEPAPKKLPSVAQELTLGFENIENLDEKWIEINGHKSYQKKLEGDFEGRKTKITVIVTAIEKCIYDFTYISSPKKFQIYEEDFTHFVNSLNIR